MKAYTNEKIYDNTEDVTNSKWLPINQQVNLYEVVLCLKRVYKEGHNTGETLQSQTSSTTSEEQTRPKKKIAVVSRR